MWQVAPIATAYKAKLLCSAVFVSHLNPTEFIATNLSPEINPTLSLVDTYIDPKTQTVCASMFGWRGRWAKFYEGRGCTLNPEVDRCPFDISLATDYNTTIPAIIEKTLKNNDVKYDSVLPNNTSWPETEWATAPTPQGLKTAIDWAFAEPDPDYKRLTLAVLVIKNGHIIAERYASGITSATPLIGWSMTKSVLGALIGIAIGEKRLLLDKPVKLSVWQTPGDLRGTITLDHLLHMSSGLRWQEKSEGPFSDPAQMLFAAADMAGFAAAKPIDTTPGAKFVYSSGTSNILSLVLRQTLTPTEYIDFPRRKLFAPLGMRTALIELDSVGTFVGSSYMFASARDWARFGLLYLRDGKWHKQQVLPLDWVSYSRTPNHADANGEYGAHLWLKVDHKYRKGIKAATDLPKDIFHFCGHNGQFVTMLPSHDVIILRFGLTRGRYGTWDQEEFIRKILAGLTN